MQQVVLADRMGLDTIWCVEHHFRGNRSHMPRNEAVLATTSGESVRAKVPRLDPAVLPVLGTAEERWQSYNVEMAEVIGGHRWKPYAHMTAAQGPVSGTRNVYQSAAGSR
jgi:alkanesulfonate monooxygenase SsuD/methylene tetrahydromethanopterin reductase-like flavin-dependent oxidoreductase (luciferase family)